MPLSAEAIVEALGPCPGDPSACEIIRAAIMLQSSQPNERSALIRSELAKAACNGCRTAYLSDVKIDQ